MSTIEPLPGADMTPECIGTNGNCYRLCARGTINGVDYPVAAIGVDLSEGAAYDASAYSGISFNLTGQIGAGTRLDVHVSTVGTTDVMYGGTCVPTSSLRCQDHHSATVPLSRQTVLFEDLSQGGWGTPADWDASQVLEIHWQVTSVAESAASLPFTVCIDDVALVR